MECECHIPIEKAFLKSKKRISSLQRAGEGLSERELFHGESSTEESDNPAEEENVNGRT